MRKAKIQLNKFWGLVLFSMILSCTAFADDYRLGPGDVISLTVWDEPDISGDFRIGGQGELVVNWLPPFDVKGLTVEQLKAKLLDILSKKYIRNPQITSISVKEFASNKVSILGEIKKPGNYKIGDGTTILSIILEAGGPGPGASDNVILLRKATDKTDAAGQDGDDFEKETYSLNQLMTGKNLTQNLKLESGDTLYIPGSQGGNETGSGDTGITVLGAVAKIGIYKYREGYTAMSAIIDAGNFTKFAKKNGTILVRGVGSERKTYVLRMGDVMDKGDKSKDMLLKPGDTLIAKEGFL